MIYAAMGRYSEAADLLLANQGLPKPKSEGDAARLLRMAPGGCFAAKPSRAGAGMSFVYLHVGAPDRILEWL